MSILQIVAVKKQYLVKGKIEKVLKNISFDFFPGEIVSLLGLNGSGKTTLLSILVTLLAPSSGQIFWKGCSIYKNLFSYRKNIGFSPQKPNLDPVLTLEQNLLFAGRYYGMNKQMIQVRQEKLIKQFGLEKVIHLPLNLLSIGYKQRFLLARTLMHDPSIIILDEPTVGLDPSIRKQIQKIILSLKEEGKTIILATHYLEEAEILSDRILIIDNGMIKQIDSLEQLKNEWQRENLEEVFLHLIKPLSIAP
ncbi:MAG: ABC transporter ATP-binding protein [Candidatus Rhabdochlamydia sp.]